MELLFKMSKRDNFFEFDSSWLYEADNRLDGGFYLNDAAKALINLKKLDLKTEPLSKYAEKIILPNRFKRVYISNIKKGTKFITTSEMLRYESDDVGIISNITANIQDYILKKDWILVSRSGTIGNTSIVWDEIENLAGTEDIIRIVPKNGYSGYIYSYLCSKAGINLLKSGTFGSVVDHIEPKHISQLPLLITTEENRKQINEKIKKVFEYRSKANKLIRESLNKFYNYFNLKGKLENEGKYILDSRIKSEEINEFGEDFRFEAKYYNKKFFYAIKELKQIESLSTLNKTAKIVNPPRSSRIYVDEKNGIPYYSGSNLTQFCKNGVKYLAKMHKQLEEVKVKYGWTLITRVGTTGKVFFVNKLKDNKCASDNILRIIPNEDVVPEYLYLFLKSAYGRAQLDQIKTGSVQDYLPEEYVEKIIIPLPKRGVQEKLSVSVKEAMELYDSAELLEEECKKFFDDIILATK